MPAQPYDQFIPALDADGQLAMQVWLVFKTVDVDNQNKTLWQYGDGDEEPH